MREGTVQGERQSSDSHGSHRHLDSAAVLKGTTRSLNTHTGPYLSSTVHQEQDPPCASNTSPGQGGWKEKAVL